MQMQSKKAVILKREEGQSVIMVTLILVVLVALIALVVDVGNAYAQRRIVQNAADAAALAAARELAHGQDTTSSQILAQARSYATLNGIDSSTVAARYFSYDPDTQQSTDLGVVPNTATRPPTNANGVKVELAKHFGTYFAQVVGRSSLDADANASGMVSAGACQAGSGPGLFPVAVDIKLFDNLEDDGTVTLEKSYRIWGNKTTAGNFHWLSWNGDASNTTLVSNLHDNKRSGEWSVGQSVPAGPGVENSSNVAAELTVRVANSDPDRPQKVLVPIYDTVSGTGTNATYHIVGFGWFYITAYNFQGKNKYIDGYFVADAVGDSEGGCYSVGTAAVKLRTNMDLSRTIEGRVAYQYLKIESPSGQTTYPVDVVQVMDTSGSMADTMSGKTKISIAKTALTSFADMLRPDIGDQIGLVRFPLLTSGGGTETGSYYWTTCYSYRRNDYYHGEVLSALTGSITTVDTKINSMSANGGTPIGDAMRLAFDTVSGTGHVSTHPMIIILASDGMTNATLNGRWTGYSGSTTTGMGGCNGQAETDATNAALEAKTAGVTVFTVAIGSDFSSGLLEAMSSPDSDATKPHFFTASSSTAMADIYSSLGTRIVNYGGECKITPIETAAAGATVSLYKSGALVATTTASSSGSFIFSNVNAGTYTFAASVTRDSLTYNVFTNGIGGVATSPSLVVGEDSGTYSIDLSLKTSTPPNCGGV